MLYHFKKDVKTLTDDEYASYYHAIDFHYKLARLNQYNATKQAISEILQEVFKKSED